MAEAIRGRLGPLVTLERAALYDVVEVAGERLLYYHEWDPCLISTSPEGARLLRRIYQVSRAEHREMSLMSPASRDDS